MSEATIRLALLCGGKSAEREVSLKSGEQVLQALNKARYDVRKYDPQNDLPRLAAEAADIDVALIILHGRLGEDGTIQGFLESLDIPYQGSGVLGSAMAINKIVTKEIYSQQGIPVAPYVIAETGKTLNRDRVEEELGFPVVVKPEHEGSSIGLSIVRKGEELQKALDKAWRFDRRCLVEKFIEGVEVTGGVLGNEDLEALPLIEIIPGKEYEFFDYEAKYTPGASEEICPARISPSLTAKAQEYALRAHRALHCRGYSRTDMIVRGDDIYVLETNTIPGMTATSLFPQAAAVAGYSFSNLLDRLVDLALER